MKIAIVGSGPAGFYAAGQEQWRGRPFGRPRVKITRVREMVAIEEGD